MALSRGCWDLKVDVCYISPANKTEHELHIDVCMYIYIYIYIYIYEKTDSLGECICIFKIAREDASILNQT